MKVEMIFMTAVLGIAGIHLLFSVLNFLARFKGKTAEKEAKQGTQDWYVFFDKSELYGDQATTPAIPETVKEDSLESYPATQENQTPQEAYA